MTGWGMKHVWGDELVDAGYIGGEIGEAPEPYWITVRAAVCGRCGLNRRQTKGRPCEPVGTNVGTEPAPETPANP